jgi:DNA-binding transcriptional ArsR family regulator
MPRLTREGAYPQLAIDSGGAYELLMSLSTVFDEADHSVAEIGQQWIAEARNRAGAELMDQISELTQGNADFLVHLVPLAYDAPAPRTARGFIDHLASVDARDMLLLVAGYFDYHMRRAIPPETMRNAIEGDKRAARECIVACEQWPEWQAFLSHILARDADEVKAELLAALEGWYERVWKADEPTALPIVERDAEAKRDLARQLPFERFVETATNGVQFVPHAGVDRLVLIPSWVHRPWVSYAEYGGTMFLVYPVADESVAGETDAPPLRLLRLTKALGDEKRLRILRALAAGPLTLVELAEQFEVAKTTMHHHMVMLRSAGLVSVGAGAKEYRLRSDVLPSLATMLGGYLGSGVTTGAATGPGEAPSAELLPAGPAGRRGRRRPGVLSPSGPDRGRQRSEG